MSLHDEFYKLMDNYGTKYDAAWKNNNFSDSFKDIITKTIPQELTRICALYDPYKLCGSYGVGRWARCPWIAVFDTRITDSASKGAYIVYLLNRITKELYLTLALAVNEVSQQLESQSQSRINEALREKTNSIREILKLKANTEMPDTGSKGYDSSIICFKKYTFADLPDDVVLKKDLEEFLAIYLKYYKIFVLHEEMGQSGELENSGPVPPPPVVKRKNLVVNMKPEEVLPIIKSYISSQGFTYEDNLIDNLYLCLKSKPFAILAGTSGTGKTRLVKLFAEAIGANKENGRCLLVPVRPDWSDSSDLFGHIDLDGNFVPGTIIDFIKDACDPQNKDLPFFLCLDEMNLARVEYYLSDFLSVVETRDLNNDDITTDELITDRMLGERSGYKSMGLPSNLYVVGTVNMDETTFPFSKKVLDRANTIEFNYVNLKTNFQENVIVENVAPIENLGNAFLKSEYVKLQDCILKHPEEAAYIDNVCEKLYDLNEILRTANLHVGYRVRDEIVFYMLYGKLNNILSDAENFDNAILQKVLPRINGSSSAVNNLLVKLLVEWLDYDRETLESFNSKTAEDFYKDVESRISNTTNKKSARKVAFMYRRMVEDGFTSYWL